MFELEKTQKHFYSFSLKTESGQIILSGEDYDSEFAAKNAIDIVRKYAAEESRYERKTSKEGKFYFIFKSPDGIIIGSSQMFSSESGMENGIEAVIKNAPTAKIEKI